MASAERAVRVYQELANAYDYQGQAQVRDRFLCLAADAALAAGRTEEAERIRDRLLKLNPHHLLKPFASLVQALQSPDVKSYIEGLRRTYPRENATQLLESFQMGGEEAPPVQEELAPAPPPALKQTPAPPAPPALKQTPAARPPAPAAPKPEPPPLPGPVIEPIPFASEAATVPPRRPAPVRTPVAKAPVTKEPARAASPPAVPPERDRGKGGWVPTLLFVLVLAAGTALGVYTLGRMFVTLPGSP